MEKPLIVRLLLGGFEIEGEVVSNPSEAEDAFQRATGRYNGFLLRNPSVNGVMRGSLMGVAFAEFQGLMTTDPDDAQRLAEVLENLRPDGYSLSVVSPSWSAR